MANLRLYPLEETLDDLFKGFFVQPVSYDGKPQRAVPLKIDVTENEQAYVVYADIPGVSKENIEVTIDGDQISISAQTRSQKEVKENERVLRAERHYGKVERSFQLAQEVDEATAQAKYTDGVLELTLPKKATARAKTLSIQ